MSSYYPIMLNITGKKAVVIGGGSVAKRKIIGLKAAGAHIIVISSELDHELKELALSGAIQWKQKKFCTNDLIDAFIIVAATNDKKVNEEVYHAKQSNQLINIVDRPDLCSFNVPAVIRRGKLIVTVSTSGASPSLSKKIRKDLEDHYDDKYESYLEFLDWCRKVVKENVECYSLRKKLLQSLIDPRFLTMENRKKYFLRQLEKEQSK